MLPANLSPPRPRMGGGVAHSRTHEELVRNGRMWSHVAVTDGREGDDGLPDPVPKVGKPFRSTRVTKKSMLSESPKVIRARTERRVDWRPPSIRDPASTDSRSRTSAETRVDRVAPRDQCGDEVGQRSGADVRNGPHSATVGPAGNYRGVSASASRGAARWTIFLLRSASSRRSRPRPKSAQSGK